MNKNIYIETIKGNIDCLPVSVVEDIVSDYSAHFDEALRLGRAESDIVASLGDPKQLAREHLIDFYRQQWDEYHNPINYIKWLLVYMGAGFLLPYALFIGGFLVLAVASLIAGIFGIIFGKGFLLSIVLSIIAVFLVLGLIGFACAKFFLFEKSKLYTFGHFSGDANAAITEREFNWTAGDKFNIAIPADVIWKRSEQTRATIKTNTWILEHLRLNNEGIGGRFSWRGLKNSHIHVELESPSIESWTIIGSGNLYLKLVKQTDIQLNVEGSGDIRVAGIVETANISVKGSGEVDAGLLVHKTAIVHTVGMADVVIAPQEVASITIKGTGDVKLLSAPRKMDVSKKRRGDVWLADGTKL